MRESLAQKVKRKRLELGLTQEETAKVALITQESISRIETGETVNPKMLTLIGLAKAFNCNIQWLLGD